jgi:hypothetical protein
MFMLPPNTSICSFQTPLTAAPPLHHSPGSVPIARTSWAFGEMAVEELEIAAAQRVVEGKHHVSKFAGLLHRSPLGRLVVR